jgi:hypothetical protein
LLPHLFGGACQSFLEAWGHALRGSKIRLLWRLSALFLTGSCATVPLEQTGSLSSYEGLARSDGILTRARISVNKSEVMAARTVGLAPTSFSAPAAMAGLSEAQRSMVANAIDRLMCIGLSDRFRIVAVGEQADLRVRAVITYVGLTDEKIAGASRVVSIGASVAEKVLLPVPVPMPMPRIPFGLGGLSVEAEALDRSGRQKAAMIWARGADALTSRPKVSTAADAYDLAKSFADDFSRLLVMASSPFKTLPPLPSINSVSTMFGGAPKEAACELFGRGPGLPGLIGDSIGLPPEWTDKGAPANPQTLDSSIR